MRQEGQRSKKPDSYFVPKHPCGLMPRTASWSCVPGFEVEEDDSSAIIRQTRSNWELLRVPGVKTGASVLCETLRLPISPPSEWDVCA